MPPSPCCGVSPTNTATKEWPRSSTTRRDAARPARFPRRRRAVARPAPGGLYSDGAAWTYHAIECRPQDLPRLLGSLDGSWRGFSLTMPLKRTVVPLLDEASQTITRIGAANTIVVTPNSPLLGENTDLYGMMQALREAYGRDAGRAHAPVVHRAIRPGRSSSLRARW
ncbi:hypothetical protein [Streptomyces sp. NBC_01456]|uniref:hypothetical protein n=1 Tax=unclassified Streptomyces TaxID=2593676 RepID=UPI003FCE4455